MSQLTVQINPRSNGAAVVAVSGMADLDGAGALERELKALSPDRSKHVVFDLSGLRFVSSITIGVLLKFRRTIADRGGRVSLAHVSLMIEDAFIHAGLKDLLPMFATVDEALASAE